MDQLREIRGINYTESIWPLALGWKITLILAIILVLGLAFFGYKKYKFLLSWEHKVLQALNSLKKNLDNLSAKQIFEQLSYYLRLILIREYGRKFAASKSGRSMLVLLEERDPSGFKWSQDGSLLTSVPYMPIDKKVDKAVILQLIEATKKFVQVPYDR